MGYIIQRIDGLGRREAASLATTTVQRVFASLSSPSPANRQAVSLANLDTSADLYVTLRTAGGSAPSISLSDCDLVVTARTTRHFQVGVGIDLWIRSSAAGAVNYTALELL